MKCSMKVLVSICCGVLPMYLVLEFCPETLEPVFYWPLPLFHHFFHPWASGQTNPVACFYALALNSAIISICVYLLLSKRNREIVERIFSKKRVLMAGGTVLAGYFGLYLLDAAFGDYDPYYSSDGRLRYTSGRSVATPFVLVSCGWIVESCVGPNPIRITNHAVPIHSKKSEVAH